MLLDEIGLISMEAVHELATETDKRLSVHEAIAIIGATAGAIQATEGAIINAVVLEKEIKNGSK